MTEIATRQDGTPAVFAPTPSEAVHAALEQWVGGMAASVRGAEYIVDTPMCPDAFWPLPAGVTSSKAPKQPIGSEDRDSYLARRQVAAYTLGAVVRYGLQLGLPPEVAVQGIFTIGGRMSMYAEQMVALLKSQGHGHRIVERSRERCIVEVCRRGTDEWRRFEFTFEDAVQAGYVPDQGPNAGDHGKWPDGNAKKSPGNAKYVTDPAAMLYARASSIACRTEFPDVLRGLVTYEEVQDEQRVTVTAADAPTAPAPARTTAAAILARTERDTPVEAAPEVDLQAGATLAGSDATSATSEALAEPEVKRMVLPVSKGRLELIKSLLEAQGLGGRAAAVRADRMRVISHIVGRTIGDPRELTADEGSLVADNLVGEAGRALIAQALGRQLIDEQEEQVVAEASQPDTAQQEPETGDAYDPTIEAGWPGAQQHEDDAARDEAAG